MTTYRFCMAGLALGLLLSIYQHGRAGEKKTEVEGTWTVVSAVFDGKKRDATGSFIFDGDKFTHTLKKSKARLERFVLDTSTKPQQIDLFKGDSKTPGIYKVEGDMLTLCYTDRGKRPTEFVSTKGSGIALFVFKRENK